MTRSTLALVLLAGCSSAGTIGFTTWGEAYIEDETTGFVDGWSVKYTKFLVVLREISLAKKSGEKGPTQGNAKVVDLTKKGPVALLAFEDVAAEKWDRVSYAIAPDPAAEGVGEIASADVTRMNAGGFSLLVEGSATKGEVTKTFAWSFAQDTLFDFCSNADFGEGVTIPAGGREVVQLTIHGDHLWYDDLQAATAQLRWSAYADADANDDQVVTLEELAAVSLTRLPLGQYSTGGAGGVKTLKDFVSTLTRTIAHFRGEGECEGKARK